MGSGNYYLQHQSCDVECGVWEDLRNSNFVPTSAAEHVEANILQITAAYNAASAGDTIYVSILTRGLIFTVHGSVLIET